MKVVLSALIALSVLAGLSASANATFTGSAKAKEFFDKQDRERQ
jgi:hypothetical protein